MNPLIGVIPMGFGTWELVIILAIAILLFGSRVPKIARSLGSTIVEFKKGARDIDSAIEDVKKA